MARERLAAGTKIARFRDLAMMGKSNAEIAAELNFSAGTARTLRSELRRTGDLPKPTTKETREASRLAHYASWESPYPLVSPFEHVGMAVTEQIEAVWQINGIRLDKAKVRTSGKKARRTEGREQFSEEEKGKVIRDTKWNAADTSARVHYWLGAMEFIEQAGIKDVPQTRRDWLNLAYAQRLFEEKVIPRDALVWQELIETYKKSLRPIPDRWPTVSLDEEIMFIQQADIITNMEERAGHLYPGRYPESFSLEVGCLNEMDLHVEHRRAILLWHIFMTYSGSVDSLERTAGLSMMTENEVRRHRTLLFNYIPEDVFIEFERRLSKARRSVARKLAKEPEKISA